MLKSFYHRGSSSGSNGSKTFKVSWGGARRKKGATADGHLSGWDPYDDLQTPKCDYLEMDGHSDGTKSEETFAAQQASPGLRDGFTEGGVLVRDMESGLHP